jgi:NADH dehydrogenase
MSEMRGLDLDGRRVLVDGEAIVYDYLVLALGSEPSFFSVAGAEEHAFPLRWMSDAIRLWHHVLTRFEAAVCAPPTPRTRLLTFVVVGGGPTGVAYAGALSELVFGPLLRDFPGISAEDVRIELLEASDSLLRGMPPECARYASERLARRRVEARVGAVVERVGPTTVWLRGGERVETETVVWTAGVRGDPRAVSWGLPVTRGGRVSAEAGSPPPRRSRRARRLTLQMSGSEVPSPPPSNGEGPGPYTGCWLRLPKLALDSRKRSPKARSLAHG